jgi:hypothetical protein
MAALPPWTVAAHSQNVQVGGPSRSTGRNKGTVGVLFPDMIKMTGFEARY